MKYIISLAVAVGIGLVCICMVMSSKNTAINLEETVEQAKSSIDVQLTARFNKFHELAECVKNYDAHEYKTLCDVIGARGKNMSGAQAKECIAAFSRVEERYPDLKSQSNYKHLMDEISVTENRIGHVKDAYNGSVKDYNYHCRKFPTSMFLGWTGYEFKKYEMYVADPETKDNKPVKLF